LAEPFPLLLSATAGDGYKWKYCRYFVRIGKPVRGAWKGEDTSRFGELVILHGIQSHSGWYRRTCGELAAAGYGVSFLDRRGAGVNDRDRGDAPSFRQLLDDIAEFIVTLPRPRFLIGISWGGKLAVGMQRRHPGLTDGTVLIAPGLCPLVRSPFVERLGIIASRLVTPKRRMPIPLNEPDLFTSNPERQEFIRTDPLALHDATARLLFESGRMDVYLWFAARHVTTPTLLLLAEKDRIIDNARTRRFVERFQCADRTVIEYPGAHHTLEFEPGGPPFIQDLLRWLESKVPPAAVGGR
jgi:alpha-beta hydrolase superfamily lysophospholipase